MRLIDLPVEKATVGESNATPVNPGGWFGQAWIIWVPLGNFMFPWIVEADSEGNAVDELVDIHPYTLVIDEEDADEETHRTGNDGKPVDLSNVRIDKAGPDVFYYVEGVKYTPKEYYEKINQ